MTSTKFTIFNSSISKNGIGLVCNICFLYARPFQSSFLDEKNLAFGKKNQFFSCSNSKAPAVPDYKKVNKIK